MKKKYMKDSMKMVATGVGLGVGSQVLGDVGSTHGQAAVGRIAKGMKPVGSMYAAGMVFDQLKKFKKQTGKMVKK